MTQSTPDRRPVGGDQTPTEAIEHIKALLALLDYVRAGDWAARTKAEAFIASLHHSGRQTEQGGADDREASGSTDQGGTPAPRSGLDPSLPAHSGRAGEGR